MAYSWKNNTGESKLKFKWENETNYRSGECITYKMNKEELDKHLRDLEIKNKYKNKKGLGGLIYE